jgi:hypothetical protein
LRRRNRDILTTSAWRDPRWRHRADVLPLTSARQIPRFARAARSYRAVVTNGSGRLDQLASLAVALLAPGTPLVVLDATWQKQGMVDAAAGRVAMALMDRPGVIFCVLSRAEEARFARTWGLRRASVAFTPWLYTLSDAEMAAPVRDDGHAFTGGDSLRDYPTLLSALPWIDGPVKIATRSLPASVTAVLPAHVAAGPVSHAEFDLLSRTARVIVVPLDAAAARSAGQSTYLNAMVRAKAVVVSDAAGVRDHILGGVTGVIVPSGDPRQLAREVNRLLRNPRAARQLGERARADVQERFNPARYVERVLSLVDDAVAQAERRAVVMSPFSSWRSARVRTTDSTVTTYTTLTSSPTPTRSSQPGDP